MSTTSHRILLVSFVAANRWTGMGRWTYEMLDALRIAGHRPTAWFADDFPGVRKLGRMAVLVFPLVLAGRLVRHRHEFDAVVVHEPSGFWYGLLRKLASPLPPMVVMCHNVESHHFRVMLAHTDRGLARVPRLSRLRVPLARRWQSDGAIRLGDHVVCLSSTDAEYVRTHLGVHEARVSQLMNGAPDDFGPPDATRERQAVLWIGGWLDVKGRHVLPELWRRVRANVPRARLTVAGVDVPSATVLAEFDPLDQASVTVLARFDGTEAQKGLYARHGVFLLCSLSEGSPLVLLEAMAARLPIVATRVGGIPDLVKDGVHTLLFDPADVAAGARFVIRVLLSPEEADRLATAAERRARELTWTATAKGLAQAVSLVV